MELEDGTAEVAVNTEPELVDASILPDTNSRAKKVRICVLALVLVVLAAFALVIGLLLTRKEFEDTGNSVSQEPIVYPPFIGGLPGDITDGTKDTSSAYYLTNMWMREDPRLHEYTLDRQMQRFNVGYVYLYYAANGQDWYQNDHWLIYDVPECGWFMQAYVFCVSVRLLHASLCLLCVNS